MAQYVLIVATCLLQSGRSSIRCGGVHRAASRSAGQVALLATCHRFSSLRGPGTRSAFMLLYARRDCQAPSGVGPWSSWGGQSVFDPCFVRGCFGFSCGCGGAAAAALFPPDD